MQLRVHLCLSTATFEYARRLLLTEHSMNSAITSFSLARHCTSTASQHACAFDPGCMGHAFRMRGKKPSQRCRAHRDEAEARRVDSRLTVRHARASRSVAIHERADHVAPPAPRTRCVSTRVRTGGAACALESDGALTRALLSARAPQFDWSWLDADCLRFGSSEMYAFVSSICACANVTETNARNSPAVPYGAVFSLDRGVWNLGEGNAVRRLGGLDGGSALRNHVRLATVRDLDIITVAV
jgi:hypothetical protein